MKKAIYKPTNQNTIINEFDTYCEILLEDEYVNVLISNIEFFEPQAKSSSLKERKENIFLNSQNNRILISDEVGLGKTIEAVQGLKVTQRVIFI